MTRAKMVQIVAKEAGITHDEAKRAATIQTPRPEHQIIGVDQDAINMEPIDTKTELTEMELRFINLHVVWNVPAKSALVLAGYREYSERYSQILARKIVAKYEDGTESREIFSDLNFGPTEIAAGIKAIALHSPNAQVRLNALALAAKASGMLKDQVESQPGVTIIIKGRDEAVPGGGRPAAMHLENQPKTMQITGSVAVTR